MPQTTDYDADEVAARLRPWLAERVGPDVEIVGLDAPGESGFSSETMLVDAHAGGEQHRLVVKSRPLGFMVFPTYDMHQQYRCMMLVGEHSDVPVPTVRWYESDDRVLGREFYVMDRVDGEVPPDNPPYTLGGFLYEADEQNQRQLFRSSIDALAALHALDCDETGLDFLDQPAFGRRGLDQQLGYYEQFVPFATGGLPHAPLDETLKWLRRTCPEIDDAGLNWGDSRIGNMMYRDFRPVAVLDWEMATLGPPEVDLAWFLYLDRFFSHGIGLPPIEGFPTTEDGAGWYEQASGRTVRHLRWFTVWAGFRYAAILVRLFTRMIEEGTMMAGWDLVENPMVQLMLDVRAEADSAAD